MKCKQHPTYQILRAPKSDCLTCRVLWLEKQVKNLQRQLLSHFHYQKEYGGYGLVLDDPGDL